MFRMVEAVKGLSFKPSSSYPELRRAPITSLPPGRMVSKPLDSSAMCKFFRQFAGRGPEGFPLHELVYMVVRWMGQDGGK